MTLLDLNYHSTGRAIIRYGKRHISVLCPIGHLIEYHELDRNFGGSAFAAELSFRHDGDRFDRLARKCDGAGHTESKT